MEGMAIDTANNIFDSSAQPQLIPMPTTVTALNLAGDLLDLGVRLRQFCQGRSALVQVALFVVEAHRMAHYLQVLSEHQPNLVADAPSSSPFDDWASLPYDLVDPDTLNEISDHAGLGSESLAQQVDPNFVAPPTSGPDFGNQHLLLISAPNFGDGNAAPSHAAPEQLPQAPMVPGSNGHFFAGMPPIQYAEATPAALFDGDAGLAADRAAATSAAPASNQVNLLTANPAPAQVQPAWPVSEEQLRFANHNTEISGLPSTPPEPARQSPGPIMRITKAKDGESAASRKRTTAARRQAPTGKARRGAFKKEARSAQRKPISREKAKQNTNSAVVAILRHDSKIQLRLESHVWQHPNGNIYVNKDHGRKPKQGAETSHKRGAGIGAEAVVIIYINDTNADVDRVYYQWDKQGFTDTLLPVHQRLKQGNRIMMKVSYTELLDELDRKVQASGKNYMQGPFGHIIVRLVDGTEWLAKFDLYTAYNLDKIKKEKQTVFTIEGLVDLAPR